MKSEPHCPVCGYTAKDAAFHLDHGLCKGKIPVSKAKLPAAKSPHEEAFAIAWRALGGPEFEREYKFALPRQYRFDFAWPAAKMAVEIDGGIHEGAARGRHMRQDGYVRDAEKLNLACFLGFRVWRLAPSMIQPSLINRLILEVKRCAP